MGDTRGDPLFKLGRGGSVRLKYQACAMSTELKGNGMNWFGRGMIAVTLCASAAIAQAADADSFSHAGVGLRLSKPAEWTYVTAAQNADNLKALNLSDDDMRAALLKYANAAIVAMTKFPEPFSDLNASFRVSFRPLGNLKGKSPQEILGMVVPQLQKTMKDFVLVQAPTEVVVSGINSGYVRMNYTLEIRGGPTFPASSEMWVVPRGDYYFLIGAGTRQDEKTGSREEIQGILKTVNIEQWAPSR